LIQEDRANMNPTNRGLMAALRYPVNLCKNLE
jgi:hypothetical protein